MFNALEADKEDEEPGTAAVELSPTLTIARTGLQGGCASIIILTCSPRGHCQPKYIIKPLARHQSMKYQSTHYQSTHMGTVARHIK
jgi:hypothetical protein